MALEAMIIVRSGPHANERRIIRGAEELLIGRAADPGFALTNDRWLSRHHFRIWLTATALMVEDLQSRNGIKIDGQLISSPTPVANGTRLEAGQTLFEVFVREQRPSAETPTTPPPAEDVGESSRTGTATLPAAATAELVLGLFAKIREPIYGLFDVARDPRLLELVQHVGDKQRRVLAQPTPLFDPILVSISTDSPGVRQLVRQGWGRRWGIYLTSKHAVGAVIEHLARYLFLPHPDHGQLAVSLADPIVFRCFVDALDPSILSRFFLPIQRFLMEGETIQHIQTYKLRQGKLLNIQSPIEDVYSSILGR